MVSIVMFQPLNRPLNLRSITAYQPLRFSMFGFKVSAAQHSMETRFRGNLPWMFLSADTRRLMCLSLCDRQVIEIGPVGSRDLPNERSMLRQICDRYCDRHWDHHRDHLLKGIRGRLPSIISWS